MNIVRIFKDNSRLVKEFVTTNSHTIKSAMAMVGVIGVGYTSHQAAKDAEERKKKATEEKGSELSKVETIVAVAPSYALPAAITVATEALIFSANKDATSKIIAAGAVATMYKDQLKEFTDKAKEVVGESKVGEIKHEIKKDHTLANLPEDIDQPLLIPLEQWFFDEHTGQYFKMRMDKFLSVIDRATLDFAVDCYLEYSNLACDFGENSCEAVIAAYMEKPVTSKVNLRDWLEMDYATTDKGVSICNFSFGDHLHFR